MLICTIQVVERHNKPEVECGYACPDDNSMNGPLIRFHTTQNIKRSSPQPAYNIQKRKRTGAYRTLGELDPGQHQDQAGG